jgi:hypothetical protein
MKKFGLLILFLSVFSQNGFAGQNGNGGDGYAAEFTYTGRMSVEILSKKDLSSVPEFDLDKFMAVVTTTKVYTVDNVYIDGEEVDAVNYPDKKIIEIGRNHWRELRDESLTAARFRLVIHEYVSIMGLNDSTYQISTKIVDLLSVANFSTDKWWSPMNPTNTMQFYGELGDGCSDLAYVKFDLTKSKEDVSHKTCYGYEALIHKHSAMGGYNGVTGDYHIFQVTIKDPKGNVVGTTSYTPEWGRCLITSSTLCWQSGDIQVGPISFEFSLQQSDK